MIEYLLAIFLFGLEAERPPTIISPHQTVESCNRAREGAVAEIKQQGAEAAAYPACLKIIRGGGSPV